jgi:hypothetical protein
MACPLFLPDSPLHGPASEAAPLGDVYDGQCAADIAAPITADILRQCCNRGYARDRCQEAAKSDVDAFRFLVKRDRGASLDIAWSSERNHHPVAVGSLTARAGITDEGGGPLERQAHAYAAAYLRQTGN